MKRCLAVMLAAFVLLSGSVSAKVHAVESTGDDVADLIDSMESYFAQYLPGMTSSSKEAIKGHARTGLENERDKYFMPMMSALAYIRKAGQSGEAEGVKDVIGEYYKLSESAQSAAVSNLTASLESIYLETQFSGGVFSVTANGGALTEIVFATQAPEGEAQSSAQQPESAAPAASTEAIADKEEADSSGAPNQAMADIANGDAPAPDVTATYLQAYIPGVSEEYIAKTKELIAVYSENGGGPAGSGALWRCIREIGELMGRVVDMAPDYSGFTVTQEGETEFLKLSDEVQEQVIAKVKEGMTGIAVTAQYSDGTFTFTKLGQVQFTYTVAGFSPEEPEPEESPAAQVTSEPEAGSALAVIIIAAVAAVAGIVLLIVFRDKLKRRNAVK